MENYNELLASPTGIINIFDVDKTQRQSFVTSVIESVKSGNVNPLELHCNMKAMTEIVGSINKFPEYKEAIMEQAEKYDGKTFEYGHAKITIKEVGVNYDFSECNDLEYNELKTQFDELQAKVKDREKFLKAMPKKQVLIDEETGETYEVFPAVKTSTTSLSVTLN